MTLQGERCGLWGKDLGRGKRGGFGKVLEPDGNWNIVWRRPVGPSGSVTVPPFSCIPGVHALLRKLQFLFELPARLKKCVELEAYGQAVRYYTKARSVLLQYQLMPSFQGIHNDCSKIMADLAHRLRVQFREGGSSAQQLAGCVDLLLRLEEPAESLCDEFLSHARSRLEGHLRALESSPPSADFLEFVDAGCHGFVSDTCLLIASYQELFVRRPAASGSDVAPMANAKLQAFVRQLMGCYFELVEGRVAAERGVADNSLLVRGLDRVHRRLQAVERLLPGSGLGAEGAEIVARAACGRLGQYLEALRGFLADSLTDVRQSLAAPRVLGKDGPGLSELLATLSASLLNQVKSVLASVHLFIAKDITFSDKPFFKGEFCSQGVREGLIVAFIRHVCQTARQFCETTGEKSSTPPGLLLLLSRLCLDYETSTISYILTLTDEQFLGQDHSLVTPVTVLCADARESAQRLLNHYVKVQGLNVSQMLRKSVETRDWINTIEPRNVRAVMKRVVEDITSIDVQVGLLYEEGVRKAHSSDSSKRTFSVYSSSRQQSRYTPSYTPSAPMDANLLSNIQKLFSERIDIFSPVEFNKVSVLTGIIKISLKTFLECVRLRSFGRYGLQQIQVDCQYLQLYLWRFASDENLVHFLLDEIVASTAHRCLDPVTMEQSVIEVICERG
ncbi:vacuolar protein sorting-associated protein 51 homolog [Hypanus sabinus]|uniref:vacuolar protein sorting-associated protein 51 homolog n=1 Tax=Hypanus sabinus TaxID=79690 RepID=UPI0028C399E6|nr:vacuolar protein sorting-associated protein 51 homolog [Hypanus sabinus]